MDDGSSSRWAPRAVKSFQGELTGCTVGAVAMQPAATSHLLLVRLHQHEEAGPPQALLYAYRAGMLDEVWEGAGEIIQPVGGGLVETTVRCDDETDMRATKRQRVSWDGEQISVEEAVDVADAGETGCGGA